MLFANIETFTAINKFSSNLFIAVNMVIAFTRPEISLDRCCQRQELRY